MAPPNFVPQSALVKLYWSNNSQLAMNVLGCLVTGSPAFDQAFANTVGAAIKSAFTTTWAGMIPATTSLVRVGVRDYRTPNRPEFRDVGAAVPGSAAGEGMPGQVAFLVTIRTALSGRSFRGRCYLPGAGEAQNVTNGLGSAALATQAVAFISAIDTSLGANGLRIGVLSRPAEAYNIVKTTFHAEGTTTTETISSVSAKSGAITQATGFESRNLLFETQRRRANQRGATPTGLSLPAAFIAAE